MSKILRLGPWLTFGGTMVALSGLRWDAHLHHVDPDLVMREGVFTMTNPSHAMFMLGMSLVVIGTFLLIVERTLGRSGASWLRRLAGLVAIAALAALSADTFALTVFGQSSPGHGHGSGTGPATPDQRVTAANQAFVRAFQAAYGGPPGFPAFHGYNTAYFIAQAIRKARSLDREKFVDALEGLKINTPVGEVEMRACDHQAVLPLFLGTTKKTPQYEFLVATGISTLRGEEVMPSCDDIRKARSQ